MATAIELTKYSKGSGCGCKIIPEELHQILQGHTLMQNEKLLVGNSGSDDAAAFLINENQALISTVDFFTPIVNDAFDFGRIAAVNAISDVYAMGAVPFLATAILSWPTDVLPLALASEVMRGAQSVCQNLGISLAGGHSVKGQEPMFGLSVNGLIHPNQIKCNNTAQCDDVLYLTKPLGLGILASGHKRGFLDASAYEEMLSIMLAPNTFGAHLANCNYVHAMTDVTGFGLIGHLQEMLGNNNLAAEINYHQIPKSKYAEVLMAQFIYPENTTNNYNAAKNTVKFLEGLEFLMLCDPQTSGGLLISVDKNHISAFEQLLAAHQQKAWQIGHVKAVEDQYKIIIKA